MGRRAEPGEQGAEQVCLKTIAACMNTEGGTLLIGVKDDGSIFGIERDLTLIGDSRDEFEQTLINLVSEEIGPSLSHYYRIRFVEVEGKVVCVVEADAVSESVFVKGEGQGVLCSDRQSTRSLDPADTLAYLAGRS